MHLGLTLGIVFMCCGDKLLSIYHNHILMPDMLRNRFSNLITRLLETQALRHIHWVRCITFKNVTLFEKGLILLIIFSSFLKLLLAIDVSPFGMYQDVRMICTAAKLGGFTPTPGLENRCYEEGHMFLQAYITSILFRVGFPIESALFLNVLCNILISIFTFLLAAHIFGRRTGLIAACLTSLSWFLTFFSYYLIEETVMTLIATCTLLVLIRRSPDCRQGRSLWLVGTLFGLAILNHVSNLTLIGIIMVFCLLFRKEISRVDLLFFLIGLSLVLFSVSSLDPFVAYRHYFGVIEKSLDASVSIVHRWQFSLFIIRRRLFAIPYQTSFFVCLFSLVGVSLLLKQSTKRMALLLVWGACYFGVYVLTDSLGISRMMEYYAENWLVPILIMAAVGIEEFIRRWKLPAATLFALLTILSVSVEGPGPFVAFELTFPFLTFKNSFRIYTKIVSRSHPITETAFMYYRELSSFFPTYNVLYEDLFFLAALLFPMIASTCYRIASFSTMIDKAGKKKNRINNGEGT